MQQKLRLNENVNLVSNDLNSFSGLSRYAQGLYQALKQEGIEAGLVPIKLPPFPSGIISLARLAGFDLKTFFYTYPVSIGKVKENSILHLVSQNQASVLAFRPKSSRLIVTVHDLITLLHRNEPELTGHMKIYDRFFDNLTKQGLKKAAILIADSEHTRQEIIRGINYPAENIRVIYIGVDHDIFQPGEVPSEFYSKYNLNLQNSYVLYVGSEDPRKNLRRLLEAFAKIVQQMPEARLLKIGAARFEAERSELLKQVESLGLKGKVFFINNRVNDEELACFYQVSKVFIFPSLYEGFGLPPLEAMACGTPVVSSNRSSLPEVVGDAALIVDPYDVDCIATEVIRVLANSELQTRLRNRGINQAARFTWSETARQTLQIYREVLCENK